PDDADSSPAPSPGGTTTGPSAVPDDRRRASRPPTGTEHSPSDARFWSGGAEFDPLRSVGRLDGVPAAARNLLWIGVEYRAAPLPAHHRPENAGEGTAAGRADRQGRRAAGQRRPGPGAGSRVHGAGGEGRRGDAEGGPHHRPHQPPQRQE